MAQHEDTSRKAEERRARERARNEALEIDSAISALLKRKDGRRFLWWLLQIGQINLQPFTNNALSTAFNCGKLDVGNQILARIMEVDPSSFVTMQQERLNDHAERAKSEPDAAAGEPGGYDAPDLDD